jgi:hypothetical protein
VPTWHPAAAAAARAGIVRAGSKATTTATAASVIAAATANAVVYPFTSACAWLLACAFAVTVEAMAASTARPTAPPTCWLVLKMPEARPWSSGLAAEVAVIVSDDVVLGSASGLDPAEIDDLLIRPSEVPDEARSFSLRLAAVPR